MTVSLTVASEVEREYREMLDAATSLEELKAGLAPWEKYAWDAVDTVAEWTEDDFSDWRKALASERNKQYIGDEAAERFAVVLLPEIMIGISGLAHQYVVPWIVARDKMIQHHALVERNNRLVPSE